jgi:hypothetical protein
MTTIKNNLAETAALVDRAAAAIARLRPNSRGGANPEVKKLIRSVYGSISEARLRGVGLRSISEALRDTGVKISASTLSKTLKKIDAEESEAAIKLAAQVIAGRRREEGKKNSPASETGERG